MAERFLRRMMVKHEMVGATSLVAHCSLLVACWEGAVTLREDYDTALAAWHIARSRFLSDRLTLSRKEAQMHEADVEQDDMVADYFAGRRAEMAERVAVDEARMNELAAEAEEIRIAMVTEELDTTLAAHQDALQSLAAQIAALQEQATQIASLSQRAEQLAETLPASAARQHEAAERAADRTRTVTDAIQQLRAAVET